MPVFTANRRITIIHPVFGSDPLLERLEPMSIELLQWLRFKLDAHNAQQESEAANNGESGRQAPTTPKWAARLFESSETNDWNQRCLLAAAKYYRPAFATELGELTQYGVEVAELAKSLILGHAKAFVKPKPTDTGETLETDKGNQNSLNTPDWTKADQAFTSVVIATRQLAMLKVLLDATTEAEFTNRRQLDERFVMDLKESLTVQKRALQALSAKQTEQRNKEKVERDEETDKTDREYQPPQIPQVFDMLRRVDQEELVQPMQALCLYGTDGLSRAYVPCNIFGDKARNDIRVLVKFGLVDMKHYVTGARGRPKNIVRVSPPGLVVVQDLAARRVI